MRHLFLTLAFILTIICWPGVQRQGVAQVPGGLMLPGPPAVMQTTDDGVFILQNGLLAKFDAKTLQLLGGLRLLEAIPAAPQSNDPADRIRYFQEVSRHLAPAALIPHKRGLIILHGDEFLQIDPQKLTVSMRTNLTAPANQEARPPQFSDLFQPQRPPVYQVNGDILYLIRSGQIVAVDLTTGAVAARGTLPPEMQAQPTVKGPVETVE